MADLANLVISVDSRDVKKAQGDLRSLGDVAGTTERATRRIGGAMETLKMALGSLALGMAVREFIQMADSVKLLEARIKSVTPAGAEFVKVQKQLVEITKQNSVTLEATASLYTKLAKPIRALGGDTQTAINITRAFGSALKVGGASAQEASAAIMQFGQAMASGVLRGDEFNSIAEASPRVLQAIAEGSGIAAGKLRAMAADGKLTAGVIGGALLRQMVALEAEAMRIPQTVDGAFTNFKTDLSLVASQLNQNVGLTQALISVFGALSSTVGALGAIASSSIVAFTQFVRDNKEAVTAAVYAVGALAGAMLGLAAASRIAAAMTALTAAVQGLIAATAAARIGFVAMATTMGTLPAIMVAVRTAAAALYATLGPLGIALAAVAAGAAIFGIRALNAKMGLDDAAAGAKDFNTELAGLQDRIDALGSGNPVTIKAADNKAQLEQYAQGLRSRGHNEQQITLLVQKRAELQKLEIKQADALEKSAAAQAASAEAEAKAAAAAQKAKAEAEAAAKAARERYQGFQNNIADLAAEIDLIKQGTAAEEARSRVQLARQGATQEQIAAIVAKTAELDALEKQIADRKQAEANAKEADTTLANLRAELELLKQGMAIDEARLRMQLAKDGVSKQQIDDIVAVTGALEAQRTAIENIKKEAEDAKKAFDALTIDVDLDGVFGTAGKAAASLLNVLEKMADAQQKYNDLVQKGGLSGKELADAQQKNARLQLNAYSNMVSSAKGFFKENSKGYKAMEVAEKAFRAVELALAIENTATKLFGIGVVATSQAAATSAAIAGNAAEGASAAAVGVANQAKGDPYSAFARMAAMAAIMAALGFAVAGGKGSAPPPTNTGTGTVLGDSKAQSESIARSIKRLAEVDTLTMRYSAQMATSLRNIESNISGLAALVVRTGNMEASGAGIKTGTSNGGLMGRAASSVAATVVGGLLFGPMGAAIGQVVGVFAKEIGSIVKKIPIVGDILSGITGIFTSIGKALFGTKTSIIGQGIYGGNQSLGSILSGGFDASYYTDVKKKKKFFGVTTGTSYGTQYSAADAELERQFSLIFKGFYDALGAASGPLDKSLTDVQSRLNNFVVSIGKIDLKGLTGEQVQEKLSAVFGAAADKMAQAAIPGLELFQKVGEGYFETVVRVASSVEDATRFLDMLGLQAVKYTDILDKQGDVTAEIIRQSVLLNDVSKGIAGGFAEIVQNASGSGEELFNLIVSLRELQMQIEATGKEGKYLTTYMVAAAGGLEGFNSGLQSYYENFLNQQDRNAAMLGQLTTRFAALGLAVPDSADAFRSLIQGLNVSTIAGQKMYGTLMALAPALADYFDGVAAVEQERLDALKELEAVEKARLDTIEKAKTDLRTAYDREAEAMQKVVTQFGDLDKKLRDFAASVTSVAGGGKTLDQLRAEFASTATLAKLGNVDAMSNLPVIGAALKDAIVANAADRVELTRGLAMLAGEALAAADVAANQKGIAEQQLDALTAQVSALITLNKSVQSVQEAIIALAAANGTPIPAYASGGLHGGGLRIVGENGPELEATGPSRIYNANQLSTMMSGDSAAEEIKALRGELKAAMYQIAKNTGKSFDLLDRWDGDGLPQTRDVAA